MDIVGNGLTLFQEQSSTFVHVFETTNRKPTQQQNNKIAYNLQVMSVTYRK